MKLILFVLGMAALVTVLLLEGRRQRRRLRKLGRDEGSGTPNLLGAGLLQLQGMLEPGRKVEVAMMEAKKDEASRPAKRADLGEGEAGGTGDRVDLRPEAPGDEAAIHDLNENAFGQAGEADLVDRLRRNGKTLISLVAESEDRVVGHILFTEVTLETSSGSEPLAGLAPMAVLPELQKTGIGSRLVRVGLQACRRAGHKAVVVLGHPEYYPRFGFVPASRFGIRSEYDVPDEVFMAMELNEGALAGGGGLARYQPEFGGV